MELLSNDFLNELNESITEEQIKDLNIDLSDEQYDIKNEEQANFFLRKYKELNDEVDHINEMCDDEIKKYVTKVNDFREKKLKTTNNTLRYFATLLEQYAAGELANEKKKKSLKLPFGTLQFRKTKETFKYDDKQILEIIQNKSKEDEKYKKFIKITEKLDNKTLKEQLKRNEEGLIVLDDIEIPAEYIPEGNSFSVKVD